MERIRDYFETFLKHRITYEDWDFFSSKVIRQEFSRNHVLLKQGETERYLSFVENGIIRYYIPAEENDLTIAFVFANSFASAYGSFLTRTPSVTQAETLTPTTLCRISYEDLQTIYAQTKIGNKIGRFASEDLFLRKFKREISLLNESAEQRYINLFTEQPELIREIPLKYIASYIGITPQALSRIRKRIS